MNTIGHQTIEKTNEPVAEREKNGPIFSPLFDKHGNPKPKPPFAGAGYYFWDDNIEAAHWWGETRYNNRYRIFKIDLTLNYDDNSFFDLVGSRKHLRLLQKMVEKARKKLQDQCKNWMLQDFITYFRKVEKEHKNGVFPFKMLRFNDSRVNKHRQMPIVLGKSRETENYTLMNPFYIVCVFELEDLYLPSFKLVTQS